MANFHRKCLLVFLLCFPMFFEKTVAQTTKVAFNRNHFGKKMLGHLVNALSVNSLTRCVYECLVTAKCLSLNYYQDKTLCELNSEDSMTAPDSLLEYEGNVKYTDISAWPTAIAKSCAGAACPLGQRCLPTPPTNVCQNDECDAPPTVLNATLTSNSTVRTLNGRVTYQCEDGLTLRGDPGIICQAGFVWSKINFRCAMPGTCKELQQCSSSYNVDGEFWLYPAIYNQFDDNAKVKVYCHSLLSAEPKEYITLYRTNDARYNGREAVHYWESSCAIRSYGTIITTTFQKIRLNPEDMTVINDDFTFSSSTGGAPQKYGTGGDCTFAFSCLPRQGYFHIDTSNTGLIVDPTLQWKGTGWNPKLHDFMRSSDGRTITIRCGGKCGGCAPERALKLEINTNEDLSGTTATMPVCG